MAMKKKEIIRAKAIEAHKAGDIKSAELSYRELIAGEEVNDDDVANYGALLRGTGRSNKAMEIYVNHISARKVNQGYY